MSAARKKPAAPTDAASSNDPNVAGEATAASDAMAAGTTTAAGDGMAAGDATVASDATPTTGATQGTSSETCPWCSARVSADAAKCPSCGASLRDAVDRDILGVTQIDPAAVSRASRVKPGRLATWLGAESTEDESSLGGTVEAPSKEVREEMLRLELAAIDAEIEAKKQAAEAQKLVPEGLDLDAPEAKPS
jgi:hypothetical protein